jgi:hypothetical protein
MHNRLFLRENGGCWGKATQNPTQSVVRSRLHGGGGKILTTILAQGKVMISSGVGVNARNGCTWWFFSGPLHRTPLKAGQIHEHELA